MNTLAFEWIKLRSVRATWWSLLAAAVLTVAFSAIGGMSVKASEENGYDAAHPAPHSVADAVSLSQLALVVLATLAITSEYANGTIVTTLQSVPIRGRMLAAKSTITAITTAAAGVILGIAGTAAAAPFMGEYGEFTAAEVAWSVAGIATYLAALAVMATGVGTTLRSAAGTITTLLMLLTALPEVLRVTGREWLVTAADYLPSSAGGVLMTQDTDPYGSDTATAVLLTWSLAAAALGYATLRSRDA